MANKPVKPEAMSAAGVRPEDPAPLLTIETLQAKYGISNSVFAGVCAANRWRPGRVMTDEAFRQAVGRFTRAPIGTAWGKEG